MDKTENNMSLLIERLITFYFGFITISVKIKSFVGPHILTSLNYMNHSKYLFGYFLKKLLWSVKK